MEENQGCITILAVVLVVCFLAAIPAWVYVTLGCLVVAGLVIWGLGEIGVYERIEDWWCAKPTRDRICFRKRVWWTLICAGLLALCNAHPLICVPAIIAIFAIGLLRRGKKRLPEP